MQNKQPRSPGIQFHSSRPVVDARQLTILSELIGSGYGKRIAKQTQASVPVHRTGARCGALEHTCLFGQHACSNTAKPGRWSLPRRVFCTVHCASTHVDHSCLSYSRTSTYAMVGASEAHPYATSYSIPAPRLWSAFATLAKSRHKSLDIPPWALQELRRRKVVTADGAQCMQHLRRGTQYRDKNRATNQAVSSGACSNLAASASSFLRKLGPSSGCCSP